MVRDLAFDLNQYRAIGMEPVTMEFGGSIVEDQNGRKPWTKEEPESPNRHDL
jgi:hypothetical protein